MLCGNYLFGLHPQGCLLFTPGADSTGEKMTEKRIKVLKDEIALLQILSEGCRQHPAYRARRPATGKCAPCVTMWQARCNLNQLQEDSAAR